MADYITTYSKTKFAPLEPNEKDISIEDIAKLNLTKLYKRKENGTIQGNGDNR